MPLRALRSQTIERPNTPPSDLSQARKARSGNMGCMISHTWKPRRQIFCVRFKATTIHAKLFSKNELRASFLFLSLKTAFDVGREQETANAMENQNQTIIGASVTLLVLSTVFVVLRLLSRKLSNAGFWVSMRFVKSKDQADG